MANLSPMMQQYFAIKNQHKDHILFFRLGDFYEMFFDDALLASKELDLTLTGRDCGMDERAPMCGIPYHSSEAYIQRLLEKGYKVAICEQTEEPGNGKKIISRDVIRVVTPGTIMENSMLSEDRNNYLSSVYISGGKARLCFCDITTSSMSSTSVEGENFEDNVKTEISRYMPREIIINSDLLSFPWLTRFLKDVVHCSVELIDQAEYNEFTIEETLQKQFPGKKFDENMSRCLWQLLNYLSRTQKSGVEKLQELEDYERSSFMNLSYVTVSDLELFETIRGKEKKGTLLWVLDYTDTSFGKRTLRKFLSAPLVSKEKIDGRLSAVEFFNKNPIVRMNVSEHLKNIHDMERLCTRAGFGNAGPRDLYSLSQSIKSIKPLKETLSVCESGLLKDLDDRIDPLQDLGDLLDKAIIENPPVTAVNGGMIKDGFDREVDKNRNLVNNSMEILAEIETRLKKETGIPKLKVGYNRVFGYYIEVTRSYTDMVPDYFVRKQTLAGSERYVTEELKNLEREILGASDALLMREKQLFNEILKSVSNQSERILNTTRALGYIDVLSSFSLVSQKNNYTRPLITDGDRLLIKDGRHPVVENTLKDEIFIPNDALLDCGKNMVNIITGPNMAGKSTFMRQVAIIVIMAHIGCFVPAKYAEVPICDAVFTRVGASDDLSRGRSTFMVEMSEVSDILKNATSKSLIILDEIGRGTSTFDGMSIAKAVVEYILDAKYNIGCKTLFATHYHELTELENEKYGVVNYNIAVKKRGDEITFLRKIVRGGADDSYGIQVAKLAGVPEPVIDRAKEILAELIRNAENEKKAVRQLSFEDSISAPVQIETPSPIMQELEKADVNVLTPIEALNLLNKLKSMM